MQTKQILHKRELQSRKYVRMRNALSCEFDVKVDYNISIIAFLTPPFLGYCLFQICEIVRSE
jgi:hypothetical protein